MTLRCVVRCDCHLGRRPAPPRLTLTSCAAAQYFAVAWNALSGNSVSTTVLLVSDIGPCSVERRRCWGPGPPDLYSWVCTQGKYIMSLAAACRGRLQRAWQRRRRLAELLGHGDRRGGRQGCPGGCCQGPANRRSLARAHLGPRAWPPPVPLQSARCVAGLRCSWGVACCRRVA